MFVKLLILCLFLLTSCVSKTVYWGAWSEWSEWKNTARREVRSLRISSEPSNSKVYVNDKFEGFTPLTIKLSYPVLESKRRRNKYQRTHYNTTPGWLLLSQGDKPGTRKIIDSEKEFRDSIQDKKYEIIVRREGYRHGHKSISQNDSNAHFVLKKKTCLSFKLLKVENNTRLSTTQKLHDFIFKKRYNKEVTIGYLKNAFLSNTKFKEFFNPSQRSAGCYNLDSLLMINNDFTVLDVKLLDAQNKILASSSSRFNTSFERDEFLSVLKKEIDKSINQILLTFYEE